MGILILGVLVICFGRAGFALFGGAIRLVFAVMLLIVAGAIVHS